MFGTQTIRSLTKVSEKSGEIEKRISNSMIRSSTPINFESKQAPESHSWLVARYASQPRIRKPTLPSQSKQRITLYESESLASLKQRVTYTAPVPHT